jgi:protein SCO1/2
MSRTSVKRTPRGAAHRTLLAVATVVACAGCHLFSSPPPVVSEAPAFVLVADDGKPIDSASLRGRAWLASFLYTSCPGPCPRLVEKLQGVRRAIPPERLKLVSFSVDPETDTPEVLRKYKAAHGIEAKDDWTFVTGPSSEVLEIIQKGFLTGVQREDQPGAEGGVSHGTRVALVDRDGHVRGFYSTEQDGDLERLEHDVGTLD